MLEGNPCLRMKAADENVLELVPGEHPRALALTSSSFHGEYCFRFSPETVQKLWGMGVKA